MVPQLFKLDKICWSYHQKKTATIFMGHRVRVIQQQPFRSCWDCGPKLCSASRNFCSRVSTPLSTAVHLPE